MPAPDPNCGILPGSSARLYIARDPEAATLEWVRIHDLDNFTLTTDSTDTSLNQDAWIRSLPVERGETVTATGRVNVADEGQRLVDEMSMEVGCAALGFFRFVIPGPHEEDDPFRDIGFWGWANLQDIAAGSSDPFSWGVAIQLWMPPIDLEDGQVPADTLRALAEEATSEKPRTQGRARGAAGTAGGGSSRRSTQAEATQPAAQGAGKAAA